VGDAVEDLDAAYALSPEETTSPLIDALERLKTEAFTTGDAETERRCALRLVQVHDAAGSTDEAREALSDWVEQTPSDVEALRALRARDEEAERWDDVVSSCARLIEVLQGDDRVEAALGLADASERAGRPEAAREGLEQVYRDEPESAVLRARLRELYERVGARAELAQILLADAAAESDEAQRVELFQQAARLYLELGDPGAALGPLGEASKLSPDDHETRVLMIDIQIQLGKLDEAAAMLEESIAAHKRRRSPELAALHQRMARLVAAQGDTEGQLKWLNQALETDRKSGPIASELAEAAIAMANYDAAMKALRSITMMEDPKPITRAMAFLKQAQIAHVRGDTRRAQHWARKAKSLDETLEEVDAFLAEIGA
jgi:tetratricopeptide (TPR) repeat protein